MDPVMSAKLADRAKHRTLRHVWSKWSEEKLAGAHSLSGGFAYQERECLRCGLIVRRRL